MENVFNFLIFSIFITTCRGFSNDVFESDDSHFVKRSHVLWYYNCTCPPQANEVELQRIAENNDGYGKPDYRDDSTNCGCTRYWANMGSKEACEGCIIKYPNYGENNFFFVNSCYCIGCSPSEAQSAMDEMMQREDGPDDFYYGCHSSEIRESYCMCVTYSARRGTELAGCTKDLGWYPCPYTFRDYEMYDWVQNMPSEYPLEMDRDIFRR